MDQQPIFQLRQSRSFSQVFSATFDFLRAHARSLGFATLILLPVISFINLFLQEQIAALWFEVVSTSESSSLFPSPLFVALSVASSALSIGIPVFMQLYIAAYMSLCARAPESTPRLGDTLMLVLRSTPYTIIGGLLGAVLVLLATLVFIIPGLYVSVVLTPLLAVIVEERRNPIQSIRRCFNLVNESWMHTLGIVVISAIITVILVLLVTALQNTLLSALSTVFPPEGLSVAQHITTLLGSIVTNASVVCVYVAICIHYYSLVEQLDALGLQEQVNTLEPTADTESSPPAL